MPSSSSGTHATPTRTSSGVIVRPNNNKEEEDRKKKEEEKKEAKTKDKKTGFLSNLKTSEPSPATKPQAAPAKKEEKWKASRKNVTCQCNCY